MQEAADSWFQVSGHCQFHATDPEIDSDFAIFAGDTSAARDPRLHGLGSFLALSYSGPCAGSLGLVQAVGLPQLHAVSRVSLTLARMSFNQPSPSLHLGVGTCLIRQRSMWFDYSGICQGPSSRVDR